MNVSKKFSASLVIGFLLVSAFAITVRNLATGAQPLEAMLTGTILDHGVDTNSNGLYDYLEVDVQVDASVSGNYRVSINELTDQYGNFLYVPNSTQGYLDVGIQYLNLSLYGPVIFAGHFNPQKVYSIELDALDYGHMYNIFNVNLSRTYGYSEFDPHIVLTGNVTDRGVDTDGDILFNYLEVGVELNVTEPGTYQISAQGLTEKTGFATNYMYDYQSVEEYFAVGNHFVYLNFSGPGIVYNQLNPTHVYSLNLYEPSTYVQLEYVDSEPLSMQYNQALFDAPSNDMQFNFSVYPDATIAVNGTSSAKHVYPPNTGQPEINATLGISTVGDLTTGSANGTIVFPKSQYWSPYDAAETHFGAVYDHGLFNANLNATMVLPPEASGTYPYNTTDVNLYAAYSGGMVDLAVTGQTILPSYGYIMLPFNITDISDVVLRADYSGTQLAGNITFHSIGGFPLTDVVVNFNGDKSSLYFTGNVNITYGTYDNFQINETILDQMIAQLTTNFTGQGPNSLYNATLGFLECSQLNIAKNPWSDPTLGADVGYDSTINGNLTGLIAYLMFQPGSPDDSMQQPAYAALESAVDSVGSGSLVLNYYHNSRIATINAHVTSDVKALWNSVLLLVPGTLATMPPQQRTQIEAWLKLGNATAYALTDAVVNASYSSAEKKIALQASLSANVTQLKGDVAAILPDAMPPEMHDFVEAFFNTTYCTLNHSTSTFDLENGTGTFNLTVILQGDFHAELNHMRTNSIGVLNASSPSMPPWELRMFNATEVDVSNFHADFRTGDDWNSMSFDGLLLKPQSDALDFIRFKLYNWLNMTTDPYAPPLEFENLKITISGASNATHTVLLYQPFGVPNPDGIAMDYRTMTWNNASMSNLKDLMFLIAYEGKIAYNSRTYYVPVFTNSTVSNFGLNQTSRQISFNVNGSSGTGFCNITIPRSLLNATSLSDWVVTFDGTTLTPGQFNITQNAEFVFVYLNYTHSEHQIAIAGTYLIEEIQPNFLPLVLIASTIAAGIIAFRERRRLRRLVHVPLELARFFDRRKTQQ